MPIASRLLLCLALLLGAAPALAQVEGIGTTGTGPLLRSTSPTITTPAIVGVTDGSNAAAGNVGEYVTSASYGNSATVTITIASPAVISWASNLLSAGSVVTFSTTGALPTGITAGTLYYVIPAGLSSSQFEISATPFGSAINTSGTQSGTQTATNAVTLANATAANATTLQLTAGDWEVCGHATLPGAGTSTTLWSGAISPTSATLPSDSHTITTVGATFGPNNQISDPAGLAATQIMDIGCGRLSANATTIVYDVVQENFTGTAPKASGWLSARRMR